MRREAITPAKRRRVVALATDYLTRYRLSDRPCRFDVVAIHMAGNEPAIEVFQGAFDANG